MNLNNKKIKQKTSETVLYSASVSMNTLIFVGFVVDLTPRLSHSKQSDISSKSDKPHSALEVHLKHQTTENIKCLRSGVCVQQKMNDSLLNSVNPFKLKMCAWEKGNVQLPEESECVLYYLNKSYPCWLWVELLQISCRWWTS